MQSSRNFVKVHCFVLDVFSVAKPVSFAAQSLPEIFQVRITVYYSKYTLRQGKKPAKNPPKTKQKPQSQKAFQNCAYLWGKGLSCHTGR